MNLANKFVEDLCYKTKQKNRLWLEELMRGKKYYFSF